MRHTKNFGLTSLLVLALFLSACNLGQEPEPTPDVGAIFTAAAATVQAQFSLQLTQTALAAPTATLPPLPSTATPFPTFAINGSPVVPLTTPLATFGVGTQPSALSTVGTSTPLAVLATQAGPLCMDSQFIADINYPDDTVVEDKTLIAKVWRIKNTGTCTWDDGFSLQPVLGESMGGKPWKIETKKQFVKPGDTVDITIEMTTPATGGTHGGCWKMQGDNGQLFGTLVCIRVIVE